MQKISAITKITAILPTGFMKSRLRTGYKTKSLIACWDGYDKIEIFKDTSESNWMGSLDIKTGEIEWYYTRFSTKPKVSRYTFLIPELGMEWDNFKAVKVDWDKI